MTLYLIMVFSLGFMVGSIVEHWINYTRWESYLKQIDSKLIQGHNDTI